jgi:osmotically-inducible protein OsmY/sporulation protein YlmC with PRC-barrel domain
MRKNNMIIALVAGGLALATTNLTAQNMGQASASQSGQPSQAQSGKSGRYSKKNRSVFDWTSTSNLKASSIIGLPVRGESGDRLGTVKDLVVDLKTHSAPFAIVEYGGTLGIGETRVAVPLRDLKWSSQTRELILNATKAQFDAASSMPTGGWLAFTGQTWQKNIDRYYGQPSATSASRYERQEMSSLNTGREQVRNPAEQKGATRLAQPPSTTSPGAMNTLEASPDQALMTKVNSLIHKDMGTQRNHIEVTVSQGTVTLSGTVPSQAQKQTLDNQVTALPGVTRVEDNLVIQPH